MAQFSVKIMRLTGSVLGENQHVTRLKANWWSEYEAWEKRDLGTRRFLYILSLIHISEPTRPY